ncbi:MAG: hypothetical protein HYT79_08115 [Elusimicrobia bacterium]|nr:hypothetical protein [Elusimicrobiota bacterium]
MNTTTFAAALLLLPAGLFAQLPDTPGDIPSIHEHEYEGRGYGSHGHGRHHSEWNLDGASTLGLRLGFFSQPALFSGRPGNGYPVEVFHTVVTTQTAAAAVDRTRGFVYSFNGLDWSPQGFLPEVVFRYYYTHGLAVGVSAGYGTVSNRMVGHNVQTVSGLNVDNAGQTDSMTSFARLEVLEKMRQLPLFFFVQMDSKQSMALKPYLSVGLGAISTKVERDYILTVDTDVDIDGGGVDTRYSSTNTSILSVTRSRTVPAGRILFGLEWTTGHHNVVRLDLGYQAALASGGTVSSERNTSTAVNKELGPWNFSGLVASFGVDFWW